MPNKRNAGEFKRTKRRTQIRIQGKSYKNGFENHTNKPTRDWGCTLRQTRRPNIHQGSWDPNIETSLHSVEPVKSLCFR